MYDSFIIMIIVVKYFASISDVVGKTSEKIYIKQNKTAGDIWSDVSKNIKYTGAVKVAVNHEYVHMDYVLKNNDEVAFFPPVTGG
tara:strand:- start:322 stop:576 length:255 start_codon:yes stop_codon:yes gene_type:complete